MELLYGMWRCSREKIVTLTVVLTWGGNSRHLLLASLLWALFVCCRWGLAQLCQCILSGQVFPVWKGWVLVETWCFKTGGSVTGRVTLEFVYFFEMLWLMWYSFHGSTSIILLLSFCILSKSSVFESCHCSGQLRSAYCLVSCALFPTLLPG